MSEPKRTTNNAPAAEDESPANRNSANDTETTNDLNQEDEDDNDGATATGSISGSEADVDAAGRMDNNTMSPSAGGGGDNVETVSISPSMTGGSGNSLAKSKKPSDSKFKQQKLAAWQPIMTAGSVMPMFIVLGIIFIPVGVGIWYVSDSVQEKIIDYTDCKSLEQTAPSGQTCADIIGKNPLTDCTCEVRFQLDEPFEGDVKMYYALTNFYQNHRLYVRSRDDSQLNGGTGRASSDCSPKKYQFNQETNIDYWPCGAIANSMFQDVIELDYNGEPHSLIKTGIAWSSDKNYKFKNPDNWGSPEFMQNHLAPQAWKRSPWQLDPNNTDNNGLENEDFIVWMRTAALPNFRKLYRIINRAEPDFKDGMPKGNYTLKIDYSFPVKQFQGTKSIVFTTESLLGDKNTFLGLAYVVTGGICLILGILFLFIHINYKNKIADGVTNEDFVLTLS